MTNLQAVSKRDDLKARRDPYWARLDKGCALGYRKMTANSEGSWSARAEDDATGKRISKPLGDFAHLPSSQRYDAARKAAEEWFAHLGKGGSSDVVTVRQACEKYVDHLRQSKGDAPAKDADSRFGRYVYSDKRLSTTELTKLKPTQMKAWRSSLVARAVVVGHGENARERPRSASSINRDMTPVRAAFNLALEEGCVTSDFAWKGALKPISNADKSRDGYLDASQRQAFIEAAEGAIGEFLTGLSRVPFRPGALAALRVRQFEKRLNELTIGKDKSGRARKVVLPKGTGTFFASLTNDKLPDAYLFTRDDGKKWDKDAWKRPVKAAAIAAGLPPSTTAYTMRHSVITDLVHGGLDTLTVAQLSGTSLAMIEKNYGHLTKEHATSALARLAV